MPKCDFNKIAKQLYRNHTSARVFCKFAAYFQNIFFVKTPMEYCFCLVIERHQWYEID